MARWNTVTYVRYNELNWSDMYTFNADSISSYQLGSDEPSILVSNDVNLFTASSDVILSHLGKVVVLWRR